MLQQARRNGGALPDLETIRCRLRSQGPLAGVPTVAEYLPIWLQDLEVDENTRNSYACHVRLHLIPYLGDVVLDQLRPHHVQALIRRIKERNEEILGARSSLDPDGRRSVAGVRTTGEATRHRIRAALRTGAAQTVGPDEALDDYDALIECSGHPDALTAGIKALRPAGTAVLVGMGPGEEGTLPLARSRAARSG